MGAPTGKERHRAKETANTGLDHEHDTWETKPTSAAPTGARRGEHLRRDKYLPNTSSTMERKKPTNTMASACAQRHHADTRRNETESRDKTGGPAGAAADQAIDARATTQRQAHAPDKPAPSRVTLQGKRAAR